MNALKLSAVLVRYKILEVENHRKVGLERSSEDYSVHSFGYGRIIPAPSKLSGRGLTQESVVEAEMGALRVLCHRQVLGGRGVADAVAAW